MCKAHNQNNTPELENNLLDYVGVQMDMPPECTDRGVDCLGLDFRMTPQLLHLLLQGTARMSHSH